MISMNKAIAEWEGWTMRLGLKKCDGTWKIIRVTLCSQVNKLRW